MREFYQDVREKKSLVPSARHKKCGSKSKFVSMPHDNMTPAQWRKKNGVVNTYDLKAPMTWDQFKNLPNDLKGEYITNLQKEFSVSGAAIAKCFGITQPYLKSYLDSHGVAVTFPKGRSSAANAARIMGFFNVKDESCVQPELEIATPVDRTLDCKKTPGEVHMESPENVPEPAKMRLPSFTLNFEGPFDVDVLAQSLKYMIGSGKECRITVTVTKE